MRLLLLLMIFYFSATPVMTQEKDGEELASYTGVIQKIEGVSFVMAGTHKLMDGKKRICLLTSREVNLDDYLNHRVKVTGLAKVAVEEGSPMLIVTKVESAE